MRPNPEWEIWQLLLLPYLAQWCHLISCVFDRAATRARVIYFYKYLNLSPFGECYGSDLNSTVLSYVRFIVQHACLNCTV